MELACGQISFNLRSEMLVGLFVPSDSEPQPDGRQCDQARSLATGDVELPPILAGSHTAVVERKVRQFYISIEGLFDLWLRRHEDSAETMRAYRRDVFSLLEYLGIAWPGRGATAGERRRRA